ncbi:hypothetical protein F5883DRAFT_526847 [Diaporthe sp. PMI_573]|nr:hypothetical protein F5883DRAFT_526847 [Diaporthaceae sp. PMI_573]
MPPPVRTPGADQEAQNHNITKGLLTQSQNCTQAWERACIHAQAQLHHAHLRVSTAETRSQQLTTENARLNLVLNHLKRVRTGWQKRVRTGWQKRARTDWQKKYGEEIIAACTHVSFAAAQSIALHRTGR